MVPLDKTFEKDGEVYKIRFFDTESFYDLRDLREIVQSKGVQEWMSSVRNMTHRQYAKWMNEKGQDNNFLFAIAGADQIQKELERVHGFIYIYPSEIIRGMLEISYAKRPGAPGGLISPGLKVACHTVREVLGESPRIIAEIERDNEASIAVIEKSGFVKFRNFDRYGNGLWVFDWGRV